MTAACKHDPLVHERFAAGVSLLAGLSCRLTSAHPTRIEKTELLAPNFASANFFWDDMESRASFGRIRYAGTSRR